MDVASPGPSTAGHIPASPPQVGGPGRRLRVLLIDDNARFRAALAGLLALAGFEVLEAADGTRGMTLARESSPDVVITDIYMPEVGGLPTIEHLRRCWPALKIVAMSAADGGAPLDLAQRSVALGADRFLGKPFDARELLAVISQLFEGAVDRGRL